MVLDLLSTAVAAQSRWSEALALVNELEGLNPARIAWKVRRAAWAYRREPSPSAVALLEELVRLHPARMDARLALAEAHARAGRYQETMGLFGRTMAEWSTLPEPGRGLVAAALRAMGRTEEALDLLRTDPLMSVELRLFRAELLAAEHDVEAANAEFAELADDPHSDGSLFLAWAHVQRDANRSLEILEQGRLRFPDDVNVVEALAVRRWNTDDARGALEAADYVFERDDLRSRAWFVKVEALGRLRPDEDLDTLLERFETRFASQPAVMLGLADLLSSRSRIGDTRAVRTALRWVEQLLADDFQRTSALMTKARLLGALGEWSNAFAAVNVVLEDVPESTAALKLRAELLSYMGRHDEAVDAYAAYLERAPDDLAARRQQARVEGWGEAYGAALDRYTKLVEQMPSALAIRAEADAKRAFYSGRWRAAVETYQHWMTLEPDDREAQFELAQSYDQARQPVLVEQTYVELLSHQPSHRQAEIAHARLRRRRAASVQMFSEGQSSDGYQRQRLLDLFDSGVRVEDDLETYPRMRFAVAAASSRAGAADQSFGGNHVTGQVVTSLGANWRVSGMGGWRSFPGLGGTTGLGQASASWWPADGWQVNGGVERAPLLENLDTLRQNISYAGPFAELVYDDIPDLELEARVAWDAMTDHNARRRLRVAASGRLMRGRTDLRVVGSVEHLGHRTTTDLYFSPRSFWREDVGIQWRRQLTTTQFYGDRDRSLLVRYLIGVDDRRGRYHTTHVELAYEFAMGVGLVGHAQWIRSSVYDSTSLAVALRLGGLLPRAR